MSFTPGPWHRNVDEEGHNPDICVTDRRGDILCDIGGGLLETRLANARLIAAAPDLLAACKEAAHRMRHHLVVASPWGNEVVEELEAAIAKAEGKQ